MDPASVALSEGLEPDEPTTYTALSNRHDVPRTTLWNRAHGQPSIDAKAVRQQYLTPAEEKALANYVIRMSAGYPIRVKHIASLAFVIASQRSPASRPAKPPGKNWHKAFEKRHPELKSRKVKAVDWKRHDNNIYDKAVDWFQVIGPELNDPDIEFENVYNMDETGIMLCLLGSTKVLVSKNDTRNYRGGGVRRTMVTAIECISADGRSLDPMIIWPATTHRSTWTTYPTPGWHYACSESGYTDSHISLEWLIRVFDPQTKARAGQKPRLLICDGFGSHETLEILEFCFSNNIRLCRIPSHTSHKLQPCDVGVFAPLKAAYRNEAEQLWRGGANTLGKEHFTALYSCARKKALTPRNIKAGWAKAGLFPFSPDRVLREMQKPCMDVKIPNANEVTVAGSLHSGVLQTPVTTEALMSLRELMRQDAHVQDETGKQRLLECAEKISKCAEISIAECALLKDENQLLFKQNDEAKVRKSGKSTVVGKARVMKYEDIETERNRRAAKEADAAAKTNKRKRNNPATAQKRAKRARRSELEVAEDEIVAEGLSGYCSVFPSR